MSAGAAASPQVCYDEALAWARERKTFGAPLVEHQVDPPQADRHADAHRSSARLAARRWSTARHDAGDADAELGGRSSAC